MASAHPSDSRILAFWAWFATIANELADDFDNKSIQAELDVQLARLGEIAWELGPGSTAENALAISPDGTPELMALTQRIVSLAPKLIGWEFLPARPARAASLEFALGEIEIDARSWRYVLFKFPDKMFGIVLEQNNLEDASEDDRYTAAVVLLDALLGEGKRLLRIRDVEPVVALTSEHANKANPITLLPEHLDSLS